MTPELDYALGRLDAVVANERLQFGKRLFAILFSCDRLYIHDRLQALIAADATSELWRSRIGTLAAAAYLAMDQLQLSLDRLNGVDASKIVGQDAWDAFYASTYNFLRRAYHPTEFNRTRTIASNPAVHLIGDSHVLGVSMICDGDLMRSYVPGVKLQILASPQHNAHKQALMNAHALTYGSRVLAYSIGEIDSRELSKHLIADLGYWRRHRLVWAKAIRSAYGFITQLANPLQMQMMVMPPVQSAAIIASRLERVPADRQQAYLERACEAQEEFIKLCEHAADDLGLHKLSYEAVMLGEDGFVSSDSLLDHAHFTHDVYRQLYRTLMAAERPLVE